MPFNGRLVRDVCNRGRPFTWFCSLFLCDAITPLMLIFKTVLFPECSFCYPPSLFRPFLCFPVCRFSLPFSDLCIPVSCLALSITGREKSRINFAQGRATRGIQGRRITGQERSSVALSQAGEPRRREGAEISHGRILITVIHMDIRKDTWFTVGTRDHFEGKQAATLKKKLQKSSPT